MNGIKPNFLKEYQFPKSYYEQPNPYINIIKEGLATARPFFFFYWIMHLSIICFAIKSSS